MTNLASTHHSHHHQIFQEFLRDHGVDEVHGLELLRQIHHLANTYENVTSERMRATNMSEPRWRLLLRLWLAEMGGQPPVRPTQLSRSQQVSKNTISTHLRSLEDQGLIVREIDPDDRRQFRIRLSESGRLLVAQATPGHIRFLNQLTAGLTMAEIEQLQTLLRRLQQSLLEHGQLGPVCSESVTSEK